MTKAGVKSYKAQTGLSLINVLVALNISILCAIASMTLYTNHQVAADDVRDLGTINQQVALAMLVLQKEVSSAGFGIEDADATNAAVVNSGGGGAASGETRLLWRYMENGTTTCRGVREVQQTIDTIDYRVLSIVESISDCDGSSALASLAWDTERGIIGQWKISNDLASYLTTNGTLFSFQLAPASCAPFGMGAPSAHVAATINAPSLAEINGVIGSTNTATICLLNMTSS